MQLQVTNLILLLLQANVFIFKIKTVFKTINRTKILTRSLF